MQRPHYGLGYALGFNVVAPWKVGQTTIDYLIGGHKLEHLEAGDADVSSFRLLERATLRIKTAQAGLDGGDPEGAYVASYDAYRMAADSLLVRQELRATGGFGSHAVVEDAVSAQFGSEVPPFAKPTFERFRRTRNAAQYFDPDAPEIADDDHAGPSEHHRMPLLELGAFLSRDRLGHTCRPKQEFNHRPG